MSAVRVLLLASSVLLLACGDGATPPEPVEPLAGGGVPQEARPMGAVDAARIAGSDGEPGEWLAHGRSYSEQRFSPLTQIDRSNVAQLGLAWSFDLGSTRGVEATPIVVDGIMYVSASWSRVFALDAATGELLWKHDPKVPGNWGRYACCDVVNRGVAVWKGSVFVGTIDGRLVSLDAATGDVNWEVLTIDRSRPYTITGAPRVVKDKVIIGNGGAELGVRGYVTAYDTATGEQRWRFYTVPGDPSLPFEHPELEQAAKTWSGGEWWKIGGGGTAWDAMAHDPELDLLYIGTGNGAPWTRYVRSPGGGDNLFLCSILALRPDTGELVWHYQTTPGDNWDYTSVQHIMLADLEIGGRTRKVLMQAPKNGFFYVLDRATGELLSAEPFAAVNWASHVDMETGRPVETEVSDYQKEARLLFPGPSGAHNWHPMAFHPGTGLVYVPANDFRFWYSNDPEFEYEPGGINLALDVDRLVELTETEGPPDPTGTLLAWDPVAQKAAWRVQHPGAWNGGLLATAGGLVFQGTPDGFFRAYDAESGTDLFEVRSQTGIMAAPVSYTANGEQHVAVAAGYGGGVLYAALDHTAVKHYRNEGRVLAFKLGGTASMPTNAARDSRIPEPPALISSAEEIAAGKSLYNRHCFFCHGISAESSGVLPDLRQMAPERHAVFEDIVIKGIFSGVGMPSFREQLTPAQVADIRAYIVSEAQAAYEEQEAAPEPPASPGDGGV